MALRTKNAIRRSFIELLAERPFDKISVRDIADGDLVGKVRKAHKVFTLPRG